MVLSKANSLLVYVGNPTQYHSPIWRAIAHSEIEVEVLFGDEIGAKPFYSAECASIIEWDVPVLEGYAHRFFKNWSASSRKGFWSRTNPSIFSYVFRNNSAYVLIHGYDTASSWLVYFAALLSRKKIIWRGETIEPRGGGRKWIKTVKSIVLPIYFLGCHKMLYSCILNKLYLEKFLPVNSPKLVSFPCAVDNSFFCTNRLNETADKERLRQELGLPENHVVIASCSRLTKRKRIELIIESISRMTSKEVSLLLIGDGVENQSLTRLAKSLGVQLKVTGIVGQYKVAQLLSIVDVFVLMSSYDASPKALNEAANYAIPLIASEGIGTSRDLVHHGVNGYVICAGEESRLTGYFDLLVSDPKKRKKMGEKTKDIIENYSIDSDLDGLREAMKNDG